MESDRESDEEVQKLKEILDASEFKPIESPIKRWVKRWKQ